MNKALKITLIALSVIVLLVLVLFLYDNIKPKVYTSNYYSEEPEKWVEETPYDNIEDNYAVNVQKATRGKGSFETYKLEYMDSGVNTIFLRGFYNGTAFTFRINNTISLDNELIPNDGIPEGFILMKKEEEKFNFYIYIDEDWKKKIKTNILWSDDFEKGISEKQFDFSGGKNGIYIEKIENLEWFKKSPRTGGIYVGDLTKDNYKTQNVSGKTFMYAR